MNILVTGANGFIGQTVCRALTAAGHTVYALVRTSSALPGQRDHLVECIHAAADFVDVEKTILPLSRTAPLGAILHLAARVHTPSKNTPQSAAAHHETNVAGTLRVAHAAVQAGVPRFIFVSSIKALGEIEPGRPWREDDTPVPSDPYGQSKYAAEAALRAFSQHTGLDIVIVRPPLVYGPGVRAHFFQLMHAIARGWPLPLGAMHAPRSFVYVENLADALTVCVTHPDAAGQTFHISDGLDQSVAKLSVALGQALGIPARLWQCPVSILSALALVTGRSAQIRRLIQPLRLDITRARAVLGWSPPYAVEDGLQRTAARYKNHTL